MPCKKCESDRIVKVSAKCSDLFFAKIRKHEHNGYVPDDMGIGGGDYVEFDYCLNCGQIVGRFPKNKTKLEKGQEE